MLCTKSIYPRYIELIEYSIYPQYIDLIEYSIYAWNRITRVWDNQTVFAIMVTIFADADMQ